MNESWPTMNTSMIPPHRKPESVSSVDINSLLKGRTFHKGSEEQPFDWYPDIPQYSQEEMLELEAFCKQRGIIGVNFSGMNPRTVLNMLKGKTEGKHLTPGKHIPETRKGILHG